jgi:hypothetical protein
MMAGAPHRTAEERKLSNNGRVFMEWIVLRTELTGKPRGDKERAEPAALRGLIRETMKNRRGLASLA